MKSFIPVQIQLGIKSGPYIKYLYNQRVDGQDYGSWNTQSSEEEERRAEQNAHFVGFKLKIINIEFAT